VLASGSILGMFDFGSRPIPENRSVILNPANGEVVRSDVWGY